ncbi:prepilin-type N-terminal cleavage/methylation domain-containing protein [Cronobacter sakazakii]
MNRQGGFTLIELMVMINSKLLLPSSAKKHNYLIKLRIDIERI